MYESSREAVKSMDLQKAKYFTYNVNFGPQIITPQNNAQKAYC